MKDRNGYPITVEGGGSFVEVVRPGLVAGREIRYRGLVVGVTSDAGGALLRLSEWRAGRFTGKDRVARPRDCEVKRAPESLREEQAAKARRKIG